MRSHSRRTLRVASPRLRSPRSPSRPQRARTAAWMAAVRDATTSRVTPALPAAESATPDRWPPWQQYRDAATAGAPVVEFVSAGSSRCAFVSRLVVDVRWASGVHARALRRSALDVAVACDGEEAPKRRGARAANSAAPLHVPPLHALVFPGATMQFFPTRSGACCVIFFRRAVPATHSKAAAAIRRVGNAATLALAITSPIRAAMRRFTKPRTVGAAVVSMAALRDVCGDASPASEHTLQLPILAVPHHLQLEPTPQLVAMLEAASLRNGADGEAERYRRVRSLLACRGCSDAGDSAASWSALGTACVAVSLQCLAGRDDGGYEGPERLRIVSGAPAPARLLANHWVCSHDNIFSVLSPEEAATLEPEALAERTPRLKCWFGYGLLGGGASHAPVHVFGQRRDASLQTDAFRWGGRFVTDAAGFLELPAPRDMHTAAGHYALRAVVESDATAGEGSIFLLEKGTPFVLFDLDGTLNVGDEMMVQQMTLDAVWAGRIFDARPQKGAVSVCRAWAAKGYQCIYLSGRQGGFYNHSRHWLRNHGFPPGPIALTEFLHLAALPGKGKVLGLELAGAFKRRYVEGLVRQGLTLYAAYGNTLVDVDAYTRMGCSLERLYICGPHAGAAGTAAVRDWGAHLAELWPQLPRAQPPIPYHCLHF